MGHVPRRLADPRLLRQRTLKGVVITHKALISSQLSDDSPVLLVVSVNLLKHLLLVALVGFFLLLLILQLADLLSPDTQLIDKSSQLCLELFFVTQAV